MDIEKIKGEDIVGLELATGVPIEYQIDVVDGEPKVLNKRIFNQDIWFVCKWSFLDKHTFRFSYNYLFNSWYIQN